MAAALPVPRLDAPDKVGRLPLRAVLWLGAGLASGPLLSPLVAWLHGAAVTTGWDYGATWLLWLLGLLIGVTGACLHPGGLDLFDWLALRLAGFVDRSWGPLARARRAAVLPDSLPSAGELAALPERLLWAAWSRPGGLLDYSHQHRRDGGRLAVDQHAHAVALRRMGAIRQTSLGAPALVAKTAPAQAAYFLRDWPPRIAEGSLAPLLFAPEADVQLVVQSTRLTPAQARDKLRRQRTVQTDVVRARAASGAPVDYEDRANLDSPDALAQALVEGERLYDVGVALVYRAATPAHLDAMRETQRTHAESVALRWEPAPRDWRPQTRIPYRRTVDSGTLLSTVPYLARPLGTPAGPLWGVALADRQPARLDLWDTAAGWPGPHLAVVGPNGGGKTVTLGHLIAEHRTQPDPPDVLIVDPVKGDYRRLVRELGGQIVRFGATGATGATSSPVVLNAFDLPPAVSLAGTGEETPQNPVLVQTRLATGLLALMTTEPGERLRRGERAQLEQAILAAYAARGIVPEQRRTWTTRKDRVPVLPDVLAQLVELGAHDLATRLRPFCTGTLSGLFSRPTSLRLQAGVVSFDLEGVDEELRPLAVWLIGNYVWQLAKSDRKRRILSLEEVKTLLESPESARLVAHLYSLARAYRLSVWSATQLLADYSTTPEGERALQNAHTVFLLRQAPGKGARDAQERYGLSDDDRTYLERCPVGEGVLVTPKGRGRLRIVPSPLELWWMGGPAAGACAVSPSSH